MLKDDGTSWVNIGDGFTSGNRGYRAPDKKNPARAMSVRPDTPEGLKPKDLMGIPWRLAFALQDDGWYLRSDVVWNKPNAMPESVKDRPTRSHEFLFMFTKSEKYYYDREAVKEPGASGKLRNRRTVWDVNTQAFPGAHFATFPTALIEPCILASTKPGDYVLDPFFGSGTVGVSSVDLDRELSEYVPQEQLKALAKHGLRGELVFPVSCLFEVNPRLLGYYRLLLGFSQKEFYTTKFGLSGFKSMEVKGILTDKNAKRLKDLCKGLVSSAVSLVDGIGADRLSKQLLAVGPQLRGGANVKKGIAGIVSVFQSIHDIVEHAAINSTASKIELANAADRRVLIEFAPDPDIVIREQMSGDTYRNIIAVEVKVGTDFSNIHNRVGEAEKSHQKAKADGYVECWTVVNVDNIDMDMAAKESPTTNRFYRISALESESGDEYEDFKNRIVGLTGIKSK